MELARLNNPVLDDPNVLREDDPPRLRFEKVLLEDRYVTEETGSYGYKDAIKVHVSAYRLLPRPPRKLPKRHRRSLSGKLRY